MDERGERLVRGDTAHGEHSVLWCGAQLPRIISGWGVDLWGGNPVSLIAPRCADLGIPETIPLIKWVSP
ncbi:hypothetical protein AYO43_04715 [Nitrospira sp. SCGC AG-212-E16]|nr:hypothetical protein AYO43_04715 [Nitrospira sp. SCGC AG-212-E16]